MNCLAEITFRVGNILIVYNAREERICIDGVTYFDVADAPNLIKTFTEIKNIKDTRDTEPK